ncbi:MAG: NAD-dependent epimerase/dehydratase family protein [Candidatus Wildermuthbacteria bacterium]|nr:NAD-dependent epimerase/dehydratase family protein [Candidatus Wildermuthbacteria bacterium]
MAVLKKRVAVTGATGLVGSHLSRQLLKRGYDVLGLSYGQEAATEQLRADKNFSYYKADITNFEEITAIFKDYAPYAIFHTAALLPRSQNAEALSFFATNVRGTIHVLEACRRLGIKKIIYSSSMSVYGKEIQVLPVNETNPLRPYDFYSLTKLQGEDFCRLYSEQYGAEVIVLRYAGIYGFPRKDGVVYNFIKNAKEDKPLEISSDTSWDIIYAEDVATANILALEKENLPSFSIFNIGSGKEIHVRELAERIIERTNSRAKLLSCTSGPAFRFFFDISKAKEELGFSPISLEKGLEEYVRQVTVV